MALVGVEEVLLGGLGVGLDGLGAGPPVGRAHLAVLVCELECLDEAESLLDRSEKMKYIKFSCQFLLSNSTKTAGLIFIKFGMHFA